MIMTVEQNIAMVETCVDEVFNQRIPGAASTYFHSVLAPEAEEKALNSEEALAFPDLNYALNMKDGTGQLVCCDYTATGTHTGAFKGVSPTGKPVSWNGSFLAMCANGKIVDWRMSEDYVSRRLQLGLLPSPPSLNLTGNWRALSNDGTVEMIANLTETYGGNVSGTATYKSLGQTMGGVPVIGSCSYPFVFLQAGYIDQDEQYQFMGTVSWGRVARGTFSVVRGNEVEPHPAKMNRFG